MELLKDLDMAQGTRSQERSLLGTDSGSLQPAAPQWVDKFRTFMLLSATAPRDLQGLAELHSLSSRNQLEPKGYPVY